MAARESFRVTTDSRVMSQARSLAVRNVHLPPTRTRLTPRGAYSRCNCIKSPRTSVPAGKRDAKTFSSKGSVAANNKASRMRSSSARSAFGLSPTITRISATFPIRLVSLLAIPGFHGRTLRGVAASVVGLPHIERRKGALLMRFQLAFAYQFQRRGKARGEHRGDHAGLHHIGDEILVERGPIHGLANKPFERFTRLGQRPDCALGDTNHRSRLDLPARGVGG